MVVTSDAPDVLKTDIEGAALERVFNGRVPARVSPRPLFGDCGSALGALQVASVLAFHRCGLRKTADDRAVASCDGAAAAWTIDFQRSAGRWQIASVTTR